MARGRKNHATACEGLMGYTNRTDENDIKVRFEEGAMDIGSRERLIGELSAIRERLRDEELPSDLTRSVLALRARELVASEFSKDTSELLLAKLSWTSKPSSAENDNASPAKQVENRRSASQERLTFIEGLDAAIALAKMQSRQTLLCPDVEPYFATLVSRALWTSREIRYALYSILIAVLLAIGFFGYGIVGFYDKIDAVNRTVAEAKKELRLAKETVDEAKNLRSDLDMRMAGVRKDLVGYETEIEKLSDQLRAVEQETQDKVRTFDILRERSKKRMSQGVDQILRDVEELSKAEVAKALSVAYEQSDTFADKLVILGEKVNAAERIAESATVDVKRSMGNFEDEFVSAKRRFDAVPVEIESLVKTSARPFLEALDVRVKEIGQQLVEPIVRQADGLSSQFEDLSTRQQALRSKAGELAAEQAEVVVRFGTVQYFSDGVSNLSEQIVKTQAELNALRSSIEPARILITQLDRRSSDVEQQLASLLAVTDSDFGTWIRHVWAADQGLRAGAFGIGAIAIMLVVCVFWLTALNRRVNTLTMQAD